MMVMYMYTTASYSDKEVGLWKNPQDIIVNKQMPQNSIFTLTLVMKFSYKYNVYDLGTK